MPAQAVQLGQVDILVVNGVCLCAAYMRLSPSTLQLSVDRFDTTSNGEITTARPWWNQPPEKLKFRWRRHISQGQKIGASVLSIYAMVNVKSGRRYFMAGQSLRNQVSRPSARFSPHNGNSNRGSLPTRFFTLLSKLNSIWGVTLNGPLKVLFIGKKSRNEVGNNEESGITVVH